MPQPFVVAVVGRPVDGTALQKADAQPAAVGDCRHARRREIGARAAMSDAEPVEPIDRAKSGRCAVVDVIREPDRGDAGALQGFAGDLGIGEKSLMLDGVPVGRLVEQAFEVGENEVSGAQGLADACERHAGILDIHQIDVADQDQGGHLRVSYCGPYFTLAEARRVFPCAPASD